MSREQAGAAGAGSPIEPYFDTGHFTKYDNGAYFFGQTADAAIWYPTYQGLLDAIAEPAEDLVADEDVDDLIREADETDDEEYRIAASFLGEDEVRRLAIEIARLP